MLIFKCILCQQEKKRVKSQVCQDCWTQLQVKPQTILRKEIEILVAGNYQYPLNKIIQNFKYKQDLHYLKLLNEILATIKIPKIQAIVPMPTSNARLKKRGYNQAHLLAKNLAHRHKIPIWTPIARTTDQSQKELNRIERLTNIEHQFYIPAPQKTIYRNILILDDIVTTGSSIHALKNQLEQLGCKNIHALALVGVTSKQKLY